MSTQLYFLDRASADWDRVWALLTADTGADVAQRCPCCGECWQYMGSYQAQQGDGRVRIAHEFRHRHSPATGRREYRKFIDGWDGTAATTAAPLTDADLDAGIIGGPEDRGA